MQRLIVSGVAVAILLLLIALSPYMVFRWIVVFAAGCIAATACYEFAHLTSSRRHDLMVWYVLATSFLSFFALLISGMPNLPFIILMLSVLAAFVLHFNSISGAVHSVATFVFPLVYIVLPLLLVMKMLYGTMHIDGRILVLYVVFVTKVGDVAAYFIGKGIGKHVLAPHLSPKKTWEGAVGAVLAAAVTSLLFSYIAGGFLYPEEALLLGGFLGAAGICGDLAESLIKRDAGVKDSSSLPGFGGVLDILDSLLFTFPLFYVYLITRQGF